MKNLIIVIVLTLGAFGISANIENQTTIAYVDMNTIFGKMEQYEMHLSKAKLEEDRLRNEFGLKSKDITELMKKLEKMEGSKENQQKLLSAKKKFNLMKSELEKEIQRSSEKAMQPILEKVQSAIRTVMVKENYTDVLDISKANNRSISIIRPKQSDLTYPVLKELGLD